MSFEELPSLSASQFFALSWSCPFFKGDFKREARYRLPSSSYLLDEEDFADVYMGWNEEKIALSIQVQDTGEESSAIELFFDTRDLKNKVSVSRFSHHFYLTPRQKDGFFGREISRFRNDEMHALCDPADLEISVDFQSNRYRLDIALPAHCLNGYDPLAFDHIGFTYRICNAKGVFQHFSVSSEDYAIEQFPALWASFKLVGRT